jgi:hypothetical protein
MPDDDQRAGQMYHANLRHMDSCHDNMAQYMTRLSLQSVM